MVYATHGRRQIHVEVVPYAHQGVIGFALFEDLFLEFLLPTALKHFPVGFERMAQERVGVLQFCCGEGGLAEKNGPWGLNPNPVVAGVFQSRFWISLIWINSNLGNPAQRHRAK